MKIKNNNRREFVNVVGRHEVDFANCVFILKFNNFIEISLNVFSPLDDDKSRAIIRWER